METILIYNPRHGGEINDIFAQNKYNHKVNAIKKYDQIVGKYLLKKYYFLQEIEPKNLPETNKLIASKFVCKYKGCDYVTDTAQKLHAHNLGKHKMTKEVEDALGKIEEATPLGKRQETKLTPEQMEGIPDTSKGDKDNWYGAGLEDEKINPSMLSNKKPGDPGNF